MITEDDAANPATSLQDAKVLVSQDHVMAIVGETSIEDGSWASYVASKGVPVVGGASFEPSFLTNPDFFPSGTQLLVNQFSLAQIAKQAGGTHLGTIYCAEAQTCAQLVPLSQGAAKLFGLGFYSAKISATAPSYTAPCLAAKSAGVNALYVGDNAAVVQRFVDACAQQGFKPKVFNTGAGTSNAWLKDPVLNGTEIADFDAYPGDTSIPGVAEFVDALNKYSPGLTSNSQYNANAIFPWAGGQLFAAAAKAADIGPTSTGADLEKGLYALKGVTLGGIAPPLTFTKGKPAFLTCYFATQIEDGKYEALNGNKASCLSAAETKAVGAAAASL